VPWLFDTSDENAFEGETRCHQPGIECLGDGSVIGMKKILVSALKLYKLFLSPYIPSACRFYPTCSCYMMEAIEKKGLRRGISSGLLRILRCNPFHPGGFDPVK
jgi:uncharacterized protein